MPTANNTLDLVFLEKLREVLGEPVSAIALHEPDLTQNETKLVVDCIESTFVSSVGKYVDQLEHMLASYTGAKHAIVVANGTAALQVALYVAGVLPGDEVIVPALSFVATANAVAHCGAVPHFVDSNETTLGMDPTALAAHLTIIAEQTTDGTRNRITGRRISAIVPMHTFGHPVDMDALLQVAAQYNIPVVEDAAESLGSYYGNQHTGTFGLLGTLSFNGNKTITTGGGGAILTNDPKLAARVKHLTTTAKRSHEWDFYHDEVAWNYRMPNLNAALGCAQMERFPSLLAEKRLLAEKYKQAFSNCAGMSFVKEPSGSSSNYWLNTIRLQTPDLETRNSLLQIARDNKYQCRPVWTLLHKLPMFTNSPKAALPVAEILEHSLVNIPSSSKLGRP